MYGHNLYIVYHKSKLLVVSKEFNHISSFKVENNFQDKLNYSIRLGNNQQVILPQK